MNEDKKGIHGKEMFGVNQISKGFKLPFRSLINNQTLTKQTETQVDIQYIILHLSLCAGQGPRL